MASDQEQAFVFLDKDEDEEQQADEEEKLDDELTRSKLNSVLLEKKSASPSGRRSSLSNLLAAASRELEKQMTSDHISHNLSRRASRQELIDRNVVLPLTPSVSSVLAAPAKDLEKQLKKDHLSQGLTKRSSQQDLLERGVLRRPAGESRVIAGVATTLEKKVNQDRLSSGIRSHLVQKEDKAPKQDMEDNLQFAPVEL